MQVASGTETSAVALCDSMRLVGLIYMGVAPCEQSCTALELPDPHTGLAANALVRQLSMPL